jgi:hypothetical protein
MFYKLDEPEQLIGLTVTSAIAINDKLLPSFSCGTTAKFWHRQSCCETVRLIDGEADLPNLIGKKIIGIDKTEDCETVPENESSYLRDSHTLTILTIIVGDEEIDPKNVVQISWFGESNGYYCETVDLTINKGSK